MTDIFDPPFYLKGTIAQTLLASSKIGGRSANPMLQASREVILNPISGVRLQGFYSPQTNGRAKGVAMLLHGWEGSVNSAYILRTGSFLYENGFSVFRLNYRDHGDTHHLNPGLFYAVLLEEVVGAVKQVADYEPDLPYHLAGFSMGGNFALRIARALSASAREGADRTARNLNHIISVSPVLDPEKSTNAIDQYAPLRMYFRQKWSRSLLKKQACFPDRYEFSEVLKLKTIAEMTEAMIQRYSNFETSSDYFRHYSVTGDALANLTIPTTIITAQDDPIIPVDDFYDLKLSPSTELLVQRYGGHNGFIETLSGRAWYEKIIMDKWMQHP